MTTDKGGFPKAEPNFRSLLGSIWPLLKMSRAETFVLALVFVGVTGALALIGPGDGEKILALGQTFRELASASFTFACSILSIVLAGFAIFSAVALSPIVKVLGTTFRKSGVSELKYVALHFMATFVPYLAFLAFYVVFAATGHYQGPITSIANSLRASLGDSPIIWLSSACVGALAAAFFYLLLAAKDLAFNVYAAFMTMAHVTMALDEDEHLKAAKPSELLRVSSSEDVSSPVSPVRVGQPVKADEQEDEEESSQKKARN